MKEFIFIWSIENISYSWQRTGKSIISPRFFAGPMADTGWTLRLYPRGYDNSDYLSLALCREEDYSSIMNISFNFELSCLSADTSALCTYFIPKDFKSFSDNSGYLETQFLKRHEVFGRKKDLYLPQDILTLRCRMWWENGNAVKKMFGHTRFDTKRIVSTETIHPEKSAEKTFYIESSEFRNETLLSVSMEYKNDCIDVSIDPIDKDEVKYSTFKLNFVEKRTGRKLCEHTSCFFGRLHSTAWRLPFIEKVVHGGNNNSGALEFEFTTEFVYSTGRVSSLITRDYRLKIPGFLSNSLNTLLPKGKENNFPSIPKELWNLYQEKSLCDVELKTEKKSFFAHKFVLCARSPVLLAMLTGEMKEKINKCIAIKDISADTLEKFLIFLYTDSFENLEWDSVIELYYVADKYQVALLKLLCCSYLLKNVSCDTVCDLLILADRHNDIILKHKVEDFIFSHERQIFKSDLWKELASENKDLALSTMLSKYEERESQSCVKSFAEMISSHPKVSDDFRSLYQAQMINDIVIKTKKALFPAHKIVLFAGSCTFKDTFIRTTTECFEIEDLEDDIVSRMLLFLYTDSLDDVSWDTALKLYHAADVFQIRRLKLKCSRFLLENLKLSNASDLLLLADEHREVKLKSVVEDYIFRYDEEIFGGEDWEKFSRSNPQLANETMRAKFIKNKNL